MGPVRRSQSIQCQSRCPARPQIFGSALRQARAQSSASSTAWWRSRMPGVAERLLQRRLIFVDVGVQTAVVDVVEGGDAAGAEHAGQHVEGLD